MLGVTLFSLEHIMQKTYTVWVGGVEVNDYYLSHAEAQTLADSYIAQGYDDVHIECIDA